MNKFILLFLTLIIALQANQNKIDIYTEHYPPYNMSIDQKLSGLSVEILEAMFPFIEIKHNIDDILLTNWSRAYSIALKKNNSMVFSTTRTESREKLFKWVGPIIDTQVGIIALKSKKIKINGIKELNNYAIGAVLKDVGETLLLENGVKKENIQYVKGTDAIDLSFTKMEKNRIDMFAYDINVIFSNGKLKGYDIDKYEVVYVLKKSALYYAFNNQTDDKIINEWQKALDKVKANGTYDKILQNY